MNSTLGRCHFAARGEGGTQLWEGVTLQLGEIEGGTQLWEGVTLQLGEREELNSGKVSLVFLKILNRLCV